MLYLAALLLSAGFSLSAPIEPVDDNSATTLTVAMTRTIVSTTNDGNATQTTSTVNNTMNQSLHASPSEESTIPAILDTEINAIFTMTHPSGSTVSAVYSSEMSPASPNPETQLIQTLQVQPRSSSNSAESLPNIKGDSNAVPTSCGISWLDTINTWRQAYHKSTLAWSPRLAEIACTAGVNNQGGGQNGLFQHTDLRSAGSYGEVETPGYAVPPPGINLYGTTPFEGAVLAWLCEVPGPELYRNGIDLCNQLVRQTNNIISRPGERGHYDVFLGDHQEIGCCFTPNAKNPQGLFAGAYVCDYGH